MQQVVRDCLEPLLPWYRQLKSIAPSWCGALGFHPPEVARFSYFWAVAELQRVVRKALGEVPSGFGFNPSEGVPVLILTSGVPIDLPHYWEACFLSMALTSLAADPIPDSLDEVRFKSIESELDSIKAAVLDRIADSFDVTTYNNAMLRARGKGYSPLASWWRELGEKASVLPAAHDRSKTQVDNASLRRLFDEGAELVEELMRWSENEDVEHLERTRDLRSTPPPDLWRVRDAEQVSRAVPLDDLVIPALRLRFPMLRTGEIESVRSEGRAAIRGTLPVRRVTKGLMVKRLGRIGIKALELRLKSP